MVSNIDLRFTDNEISPWGGLSVMFKMLERCGMDETISSCPLPLQGSNRGYSPKQLIYGLFAGVWCGASCFDQLEIVRHDGCLRKILGWDRGAGHRAYIRYFDKFTQADNQRVFNHLYKWFFSNLQFNNYTLDFDSTVEQRCGEQEGTAKGYNPKRPGRQSHHPLLAFVADLRMIANFWLRPGNTSASTNFLSFLEDTLNKLDGKKVGLIRMDSGFFSNQIMSYLEEKSLHYIIACRFNNRIKHALAEEGKWVEVANGIDISETTYKGLDWEKPRRIVMVRQHIDVRPKAAGKQIKQLDLFPEFSDLSNYRYSCFITDMDLPMKAIYDMYRGRADSENRIKEIKYDFSVDKFAVHSFWANEACASFIIMAYNLYALFRLVLTNNKKHPFLKKIRYELLAIPGYLRKSKNKQVLYLARSMTTRKAFKGIWDVMDDFAMPYAI